ncbi:MAG: hypothetical protein K8T26_06360 [Lentisphaerae bacterium]|nr:hypothetical protein [Lentisphaerota bacterium]
MNGIQGGRWCAVLVGLAAAHGARAETAAWLVEAEGPGAMRHAAVRIVDDATASGGQALDLPLDDAPDWNVVNVALPAAATPGRYVAAMRLNVTDAPDIGRAWRGDVRQGGTLLGYAVAYGYTLRGKSGYQDVEIPFVWTDAAQPPVLSMRWTQKSAQAGLPQNGEGRPNVRLDAVAFRRLGDLPPARILRVWPDHVRYRQDENGSIAVSVQNLSTAAVTGLVRVALAHDLDEPQALGQQALALATGQTAEIVFPFANPGRTYGYAAQAVLEIDGRPVDAGEETFTVHDNPWAVATGAPDQEPGDRELNWQGRFYGIGATDAEIEDCALTARRQYTTCAEFFSWSPGECFDLAPKEPIWVRGNGGDLLRSKRELQRAVAALHRQGIACISYVAQQAMGERAVAVLREKPEWFSYSAASGDVIDFYNVDVLEKHRAFWRAFDWPGYAAQGDPTAPGWVDSPERWQAFATFWTAPSEAARQLGIIGYFVPNYARLDVVDFCADQVAASADMFGWDGLRWDCGHLNPGTLWGTFAPSLDFAGQPQAATPADVESLTVRNLQRLKSRVRARHPAYVIGSNFGQRDDARRFPLQTAELARDGGWLMDEAACGYNAAHSPYHFWDAYYAVMADQGEHITSLGGHYHPFAFTRTGGKYPVDGLYETVFRLAGKGHPQIPFYNSRTPFGNVAQFSVRFGRFLFDPAIRRVDAPESAVQVNASAPLWWTRTVGRLRDGPREDWIVHLINPPLQREVERDPTSRMAEPVRDASVTVAVPPGKRPTGAWALAAEAWTTDAPPRTQAVPLELDRTDGRVAVVVPQILCWKTVVIRFE